MRRRSAGSSVSGASRAAIVALRVQTMASGPSVARAAAAMVASALGRMLPVGGWVDRCEKDGPRAAEIPAEADRSLGDVDGVAGVAGDQLLE